MIESEPKSEENIPLYPLRPSELVQHPERVASEVEPLGLTESDWEQIGQLEQPLAERLEAVDDRHLKIHQHHYYPAYFSGEGGEQRFHVLYETPLVQEVVEQACKERGIDLGSETTKKMMFDAALEDVAVWSWPIEAGTQLELPSLTAAIQAKTEGQTIATISVEMPLFDQPKADQRERFMQLDLTAVSPEYLTAIQAISGQEAERLFEAAFAEASGDISQLPDPERIARVVNTGDLLQKIATLRELRSDIRQLQRTTTGDETLPEAQRLVLSLYRERINAMIAQLYPDVKLLENDQTGDPNIERTRAHTVLPRVAPLSSLQRINRFLRGIGVADDKTYEAIPARLASFVENPETVVVKNEESERYNAYTINAEQMRQLLSVLVTHYVGEDERLWEVIIDPRARSLNVEGKDHLVQIPTAYKGGVVNSIAVAEHEGSHVLQTVNRERAADDRLQLTRRFTSSRNRVLSEAGAMEAERAAKQQMVGVDRQALPYFYAGLRAKEAGGTFRDCYTAMLASYAERNGTTTEGLCRSGEYQKAAAYIYARTLRLFNQESSLDDPSTGITSTEQLSYVEQEMVVPVMQEHGLGSLVYVSGVDLYSLQKLQRLGVIDVGKIRTPDFYLAEQFWQQLRTRLDAGDDFDTAWEATIALY